MLFQNSNWIKIWHWLGFLTKHTKMDQIVFKANTNVELKFNLSLIYLQKNTTTNQFRITHINNTLYKIYKIYFLSQKRHQNEAWASDSKIFMISHRS